MKTSTTSKLALILITLTAFFMLTSFLQTKPSASNKYLTLRIFEPYGTMDSKIVIVYEDGKVEEIELEKFKPSKLVSHAFKTNEVINYIANKGYDLFNVTGGDVSTTYIFQKK